MTGGSTLPLRPDLVGLTPYGAPQLAVPVRLNTNENPFPPPDALVEAIAAAVHDAARTLNRYPDREATALRAELAEYLGHGLSAEQVWAANGSNEIIQQLLLAFGGAGRCALGFEPTYAMHRLITQATGTAWVGVPRGRRFDIDPVRAVAEIERVAPSVVFLCSPNNPTGTAVELGLVEEVCAATAGVVVVDEAYREFARPGARSAVELLPAHPHLVVTRTMSKAFTLAGARVGYLAAAPDVVDALRLVRLPYHLSALTQAAARAALRHADALLSTVAAVRGQRDRLVSAVRDLGCEVVPSDANFVLVGGFDDSAAVWQALLERGVLVRDVGLPGWLRVTAGRPGEVDAFLGALGELVPARLAAPEDPIEEGSS